MTAKHPVRAPREHGSWGMFFLPMLLGFIVGGAFGIRGALFTVAAAPVLLIREPFMALWRAWRRRQPARWTPVAVALSVSAAAGIALLAITRLWMLVPLAGAAAAALAYHAEATMRGRGRTATSQVIAIAASALNAPAAYYVASGRLDIVAALLWLISTAYFVSAVFYVKMRVAAAHGRNESLPCLLYHLALLATLLALANPLLLAAFGLVLARGIFRALVPTRELNLKFIGWSEVAYSVVFLGSAAASFRFTVSA